mmetsp:Transcript_142488/g.455465  ORF Transcript_142488/g.455465 Transcript_142488/m.455465 type:complete len:246 (-) Transcript_142488:445-1182(-)
MFVSFGFAFGFVAGSSGSLADAGGASTPSPKPPVFVALSTETAANVFLSSSLTKCFKASSSCCCPPAAAARSMSLPSLSSLDKASDVAKATFLAWSSCVMAPFTMKAKRSKKTHPFSSGDRELHVPKGALVIATGVSPRYTRAYDEEEHPQNQESFLLVPSSISLCLALCTSSSECTGTPPMLFMRSNGATFVFLSLLTRTTWTLPLISTNDATSKSISVALYSTPSSGTRSVGRSMCNTASAWR